MRERLGMSMSRMNGEVEKWVDNTGHTLAFLFSKSGNLIEPPVLRAFDVVDLREAKTREPRFERAVAVLVGWRGAIVAEPEVSIDIVVLDERLERLKGTSAISDRWAVRRGIDFVLQPEREPSRRDVVKIDMRGVLVQDGECQCPGVGEVRW